MRKTGIVTDVNEQNPERARKKGGRWSMAAAIFGVWCFFTGVIASLPLARQMIIPIGQAVNEDLHPEFVPNIPTGVMPNDFYGRVYLRSRLDAAAPQAAPDVETASQIAGFNLLIPKYMPPGFEAADRIGFNTPHGYRLMVDFEAARLLLENRNISPDQLPRGSVSADTLVTVQPVAGFHTSSGNLWFSLLQGRPPLASLPPPRDLSEMDKLGGYGLQYLGVPANEADELISRLGWTWFLAFPPGDLDRAEVVQVRGTKGIVLFQQANPAAETALLWEDTGVIYALYGNISSEELRRIAAELQ